jgi:uncharacterized protein (DUF2267 family)
VLPKITIAAEKRAALDDWLTPYATALAKSLSERAALMRTNDSARAITEVTAGTLWRYAPAEITSAVEKQLAELDDREFASELSLRTVHFDALARIRPRLDPKDGRRLVELWQQMLHPSLFDDERLLSRVVEQSIAHPAFTADADTALIDVLETSYQRLEPLSRKLCEDADLILPRLAVATPEAMHAEIDARLALIKTQHRRREIIKEALQRVRGMLGDADAEMTARVEDAIASVDSLDRADSFEEKSLAARAQSLADAPAPAATRTPDESAKPTDAAKPGAGAANGTTAAGGASKDSARDADQAPRNNPRNRQPRRSCKCPTRSRLPRQPKPLRFTPSSSRPRARSRCASPRPRHRGCAWRSSCWPSAATSRAAAGPTSRPSCASSATARPSSRCRASSRRSSSSTRAACSARRTPRKATTRARSQTASS